VYVCLNEKIEKPRQPSMAQCVDWSVACALHGWRVAWMACGMDGVWHGWRVAWRRRSPVVYLGACRRMWSTCVCECNKCRACCML
jgi:hypothetical protein